MPELSSGATVYADPDELAGYLQTDAESLGLSDTQDPDGDGVSEWREFFGGLQEKAKGRIDDYCRRDFEAHPNDTVTLDGGDGSGVLYLPSPVREVHEIRIGGDVIDAGSWHAKPSGALIYTAGAHAPARTRGSYGNIDGGIRARSWNANDGRWPPGYGNIEVDCDHGYPDEAPSAVREAEMKLVDHTIVGMVQKREGMVVQADSFEMKVNIPVAWNSEIRGMLKPHRRTEVFN